jgi:hypothetical protein
LSAANLQELPDETTVVAVASGNSFLSSPEKFSSLACLPVGAHLILRCRADWRNATVVSIAPDQVTLSVASPSGRTYRVRRPPDSPIFFDNSIPVLGEGSWRALLARYDSRW